MVSVLEHLSCCTGSAKSCSGIELSGNTKSKDRGLREREESRANVITNVGITWQSTYKTSFSKLLPYLPL